jgi:hypothetical protein
VRLPEVADHHRIARQHPARNEDPAIGGHVEREDLFLGVAHHGAGSLAVERLRVRRLAVAALSMQE